MPIDRRELLRGAALAGGGAALGSAWPTWAQSFAPGTTAPIPELSGEDITLRIGRQTVAVDGRDMPAIGINGTVPAPLLRLREGQKVRLHVRNDLEEETSRRFGKLPSEAGDFFAAARLRIDCKRRGIVRLDVGREAVAATFLPGRLRKSRARSLQRDGDRVVHISKKRDEPFGKVAEFLDLLDE